MQHPYHLTFEDLERAFPQTARYPRMWSSQREGLQFIADNNCSASIESPTGSGKSAMEYAVLKAAEAKGGKNLFLITTNKTLVEQMRQEFPELVVALGRHEHPCLYYEPKEGLTGEKVQELYSQEGNLKADEIPCSFLRNCPHRVDQLTGETFEKGATPCPYLQQKYEAKKSPIVVSTMAFYLFTQLFSREWEKPDVLVIDEVHRIADVVRGCLSYEITDYHLRGSIELLELIGAEEAVPLGNFLKKMLHFIKGKPAYKSTLLEAGEIQELMDLIGQINPAVMTRKIQQAVKEAKIDVVDQREVLKKIEVIVRDLHRYMASFEYSLATSERHPLNYTYAFYKEEKDAKERVQYKLVVKCYHVAPIIKRILGHKTVVFSATIGESEVFGHESGIRSPLLSLGSNFPNSNTAVFMPKDTPNLALNSRDKRDLTKVLRRIAKACKRFMDQGHRSLVVTISNAERDKFLMLAAEEGVEAISYGNGVTAKDAALAFKDGVGDVLVGTAANYAEGVDLPKQIAPVIFFLRPGYPNPMDPGTQFEEKRFGGMRWALWNWRVMIQALQVRGRNIRGRADVGVTFFVSQQFRRFLRASLPKWLEGAYDNEHTFDECVEHTLGLLKKD